MSDPDEKKAASAALTDETLDEATGGIAQRPRRNETRRCMYCRRDVDAYWIKEHDSCMFCGASPFRDESEFPWL